MQKYFAHCTLHLSAELFLARVEFLRRCGEFLRLRKVLGLENLRQIVKHATLLCRQALRDLEYDPHHEIARTHSAE